MSDARANETPYVVYVASIGEEIKPIFYDISSNTNRENPNKYIFVCTEQTRDNALYIKNSIKELPLHTEEISEDRISIVESSPQHLSEILEKLLPFIISLSKKHGSNIKILANITGGTKIMSLALHTVASMFPESEVRYIYYDRFSSNKKMVTIGVPLNNPQKILIKNRLITRNGRVTSFYRILEFLINNGGKARPGDISTKFKYSKYNLSHKLKEMRKERMVTKNNDEGKYVYITENGRYLYFMTKMLIELEKIGERRWITRKKH